MIQFLNEDVTIPEFISKQTKDWISSIIQNYSYEIGDINYLFCSDEYILKVNNQYLNHNYFTDIITFDYCSEKVISGDLVISLDTVQSNSEKFKTKYFEELHRVIIHGVLHLIGFNDSSEDEKAIMRKEEDKALSLLSTFH